MIQENSRFQDYDLFQDFKMVIFQDFEFIERFFLKKLSLGQVTFNISTRASEKKIVELLSKRKVLVENPFYRGPGLGFQIGEGFN